MDTLHVPARLDAYQRLELIYFTVQQIIQKVQTGLISPLRRRFLERMYKAC